MRTAVAAGEHAVHDPVAGIGSQLAARDPSMLPTGDAATCGLRVPVADGVLDAAAARGWAG